MIPNNINPSESSVTNHAGVEFATEHGRHYVRAEGEWVCISNADYNMIVGRVRAEPNVRLSAKRQGERVKFWLFNGIMSWIEVPLVPLIDPGNWQMVREVSFPEFDPEVLVAQDPEPELHHPFAFVDAGRSQGYFVRAYDDGGEVWVRLSKDYWDQAMRLFHSNEDDDPEGEFYDAVTIWGVVANDEYRLVFLDVNPMGERGEIEFHVRGYFPTGVEQTAA